MSSGQPSHGSGNNGSQALIGNAALKKLCTLLRSEGDRVLSGGSSFTLTTEVLAQLNTDCRRHSIIENDANLTVPSERRSFLPLTNAMRSQQAANKARAEWSNYIQFIKDFMLSAPNLKIIHNSGTLSSPLSLHRFGNVSCLQLRKVPIHMVEGLQKLRSTLTSLTVCRCLDTLKDLLEYCGGDMSAPMTWPELKFVSLMFNALNSLDDSLRLLPHVEVLDLSHNSLEACHSYLEYLGDVVCLNLSYNALTQVPSFSLTMRASLTSLLLRGNNIDSVKGIEELIALQEIDLGENCLSDHSWLEPLSALIRLSQLQLDCNPIYYHRLHRPLTVSCLARQAISVQFELDKKKLTLSEISYFPPRKTHYGKTAGRSSYKAQSIPEMRGSIQERDGGMSPSSGIGTENDSSGVIASPSSRKKSKRKRLKARHTEILDIDVSGECSSSRDPTPGSSPALKGFEEMRKVRRDEARKTKKEIEELRKHYGPNWLQAIDDRNIFSAKKMEVERTSSPSTSDNEKFPKTKKREPTKSSSGSDSQPDTNATATFSTKSDSGRDNAPPKSFDSPTDDDLYLQDTRQSEANNPIMAAIARMASGQSASETDGEIKGGGESTFPSFDSFSKSESNATDESKSLPLADDKSETTSVNGNQTAASTFATQKVPLQTEKNNTTSVQQGTSQTDQKDKGINTENSSQNEGIKQNISSSHGVSKSSGLSSETTIELQKESQLSRDLREKDAPGIKDLSSADPTSESSSSKKSDNVLQTSVSSVSDITSSDLDSSMEKSLIIVEEDAVTESMFVSLPLQDSKMIIMTLTASFIVERDVRGKVTEKLELSCLTSMKHKAIKIKKNTKEVDKNATAETSVSTDEQNLEDSKALKSKDEADEETDSIQLDLLLDYVKKDRQKRRYVVDKADGKIIMDHLQPFLDIREEEAKAKSNVVMQCLKCNRTFLKGELVHKSKQLPTSGSSKDLQSLQKLIGTPTLMCPKCGSTIIIELESAAPKSTNSATSTPVGSYSSTGSYMEQVKKPAPLIKRKSFDHASPQATLAARMRTRKNSTESLDLSAARQGGQSGSVTSLGGSPGSLTRDVKGHSRSSSLTNWRDRSNAFVASNKLSRSLVVNPAEKSVAERDELVCVEDYFSQETSSSVSSSKELAAMTTSLRADPTTKGSKAFVKRLPLNCEQKRQQSSNPKQMFDSGFESQIESGPNLSTTPISIEGSAIETQIRASRVGSVVSADGQRWEDSDDNRSRSSSKVSATHRHLATMEDIVNTLVSEGKSLEEQAVLSGSLSSLNSRSVSISTFRKSSEAQNQPRHSVSSVEGEGMGLPRGESNSSIAVLPTPVPEDDDSVMAQSASGLLPDPVTFSVGTPDGVKAESSGVTEQGRVVSPLSSNICNSMVSSVYKTSVNTPPDTNDEDNDIHIITDSDPIKGSESNPDNLTATVVGSTESGNSSSSEDLTSIYDRPRKPSKSAKMSGSKHKSKADDEYTEPEVYRQSDFTDNGGDGTQDIGNETAPVREFESSQSSEYQDIEGERAANSPAYDVAALVGFKDEDESDENDEQDVTPQYAFHHLNHHLTLYMMMSLFGNDEEFLCKMQSEIVPYIVEETYDGILVMSSVRFYILRITSKDHSQEPDQWLKCVEIQPIPELRYIDVGLGGQSIRLEFVTDCSSYTLVTRNRDKTAQFVEVLHTQLAKYAVSQGITSHVVVNEDVDQLTLDNLDADVVSKVVAGQKLMLYCMGYIERGNQKLFPVSFVITSSDICLVRTNHQWPQPRLQAPITIETVGKQFTVLERQKVNNVASVEVCEATMKKIRLELFNEMEGIATNWNITLSTRQSTVDFINALSEPWAQEFGVEMDITYAELNF